MKKRELIVFTVLSIYFLLTLSSLVSSLDIINKTGIEEIGKGFKESGEEAKSSFGAVFEEEVKIPEEVNIFARILFGIKKGESISLSVLIILCAVWFFLFILIAKILKFVPFFGKGGKSFAGSFVVTCLVGVSGGIKQATYFFLDIGNFFGLLEKYGLLKLIVALVIISILVFVLFKVLRLIKGKEETESMKTLGMQAGAGAAMQAEEAKRRLGR